MTAETAPAPPPTLPPPPDIPSPAAVALWEGWLGEIADDDLVPDAREVAILGEAARHLAIAERLETELAACESLMVPGSRGNQRVNPLVSELDKARRTVSALLASIKPPPDRSAINRANGGRRWAK